MEKPKVVLRGEIPPEQYTWRNDPSIYAWTRQNGPLPIWKHEKWLSSLGNSSDYMLGVFAPAKEKFVGTAGITGVNWEHRYGEFSLFIAPEFQCQGYGQAALEALLDFAFGSLNLFKVNGESLDGNPAIKMFKKVGFKEEGVIRSLYEKNGRRFDAIRTGITREEWYGMA